MNCKSDFIFRSCFGILATYCYHPILSLFMIKCFLKKIIFGFVVFVNTESSRVFSTLESKFLANGSYLPTKQLLGRPLGRFLFHSFIVPPFYLFFYFACFLEAKCNQTFCERFQIQFQYIKKRQLKTNRTSGPAVRL